MRRGVKAGLRARAVRLVPTLEGIVFDEKDVEPVRFIFLVGTPKRMVTDYLRIVGSLARCMKDDDFRQKLLDAATPEEFIAFFKGKEF